MSWYARVANNNIVEQVIFVSNQYGEEGEIWCSRNFGGTWKETFENGRFRKRFACVGHCYDSLKDEFYFPKPHPSWIWSDEYDSWVAPYDPPDKTIRYKWNEDTMSWDIA